MDYRLDEGSEAGFVFSLVGGLFWLVIGVAFFGWVVYDLFQVDFVYGNIEKGFCGELFLDFCSLFLEFGFGLPLI